jgi:hypothetical protein
MGKSGPLGAYDMDSCLKSARSTDGESKAAKVQAFPPSSKALRLSSRLQAGDTLKATEANRKKGTRN